MVLTDPPYGTTRCAWDSVVPFDLLWAVLRSAAREDSAVVVFGAQPFTSDLVQSNRREFRYDLVWDKGRGTDFLNANRKPMRAHEDVLVFYRRAPAYHPQLVPGAPYKAGRRGTSSEVYGAHGPSRSDNAGTRHPTSVLRFARSREDRGSHPTQKPVGLLEWLVRSYTKPGDTVFDPFMGSGSTGVACARCGRRFVGIEMDGGYFETALRRVSEAYGEEERWTSGRGA